MTVQEYQLTKVKIDDLNFDETNPNQLTKEQEEALKKQHRMDYEYLKKFRYDWINDPRKLRDEFANDSEYVPSGRCYCCGRLFQNCKYGIAYCSPCDKAMTCSPDGPFYDYSSFWQSREKLKIRDQRRPIEFMDESTIGIEPRFEKASDLYKLDK